MRYAPSDFDGDSDSTPSPLSAQANPLPSLFILAAVSFFAFGIPTIFVLGIASGYFTRLVVTNFRIVCLQGHEICRSWNIDQLPPSLVHHRHFDGEDRRPCVDLEAVKTMLGGSSEKFTNAKTILAFGKQLDSIMTAIKIAVKAHEIAHRPLTAVCLVTTLTLFDAKWMRRMKV